MTNMNIIRSLSIISSYISSIMQHFSLINQTTFLNEPFTSTNMPTNFSIKTLKIISSSNQHSLTQLSKTTSKLSQPFSTFNLPPTIFFFQPTNQLFLPIHQRSFSSNPPISFSTKTSIQLMFFENILSSTFFI